MNKKIFSIVILLALVTASCLALGACQTESEQPIKIIATTEHGIKLSHRLYAVTINGVSYPSVDLTATISPADAPDKTVTWSVEWGDGAELASKAVTDYVTITPDSSNGLKATVTWSLYTKESSGGYSTYRYNCPVENLNVYLDIVLAYDDTTTTFRVNFTSNVNSVSLNNDSIIF